MLTRRKKDAPKWVHLSHHAGCEADLQYVGDKLGVRIDHLRADCNYNIGPDRARHLWKRWQGIFENYDGAITSDTAPLARIFLEAGWKKPLVIWVCTRFDYTDQATNDCGFPDAAYYDMFRAAAKMPNVDIVSYTEYEHIHGVRQKVDWGRRVIKPVGAGPTMAGGSIIPRTFAKSKTFFVPPYHNDTKLLHLEGMCRDLGIPAWCGRYNGPADIRSFRGVVHIPYAWSNLALFENWQRGLTHFIPSEDLLYDMAKCREFFWSPPWLSQYLSVAEWYRPENREAFVYFDDWPDLAYKAKHTDTQKRKAEVLAHAKANEAKQLHEWKQLLAI